MSSKTSSNLLGACLSGTLLALFLRFFLNKFGEINGVGWIEGLGWPWSVYYVWGLAGAAAFTLTAWLHQRLSQAYALALAEAAPALGFNFRAVTSRADLGDAGTLSVFANWHEATNRLNGRANDLPVEMIDYTSVNRGSENTTYQTQTVVVLPGAESLPVFELHPRGFGLKMMSTFGVEGLTFDTSRLNSSEVPVVASFSRKYHLSIGLAEQAAWMVGQVEGTPEDSVRAEREEAVRRLFSVGLLDFFQEHPGWTVICNGKFLALYRPSKVIASAKRSTFLDEALSLRTALIEADKRRCPSVVPAGRKTDVGTLQGRAIGTLVGGFAGFITGGLLAMGLLFSLESFHLPIWLIAVIFFGCLSFGPMAGFFLGKRFLSRLIEALFRRTRSEPVRTADNIWGIPPGSTALVRADQVRLEVVLPAPGLVRGMGCFFFIWCLGWNLFVLGFLCFFLPEALAGKVNWESGGPVSPIFAVLFLIPFVLVGLVSLYVLLRCGTRRVVLTVDAEGLSLDQRTVFSCQKERWSRGDLVEIEVDQTSPGISGMGQPCKAKLCLVTRRGERLPRLGLRLLGEIKWLAALVKKSLDLKTP